MDFNIKCDKMAKIHQVLVATIIFQACANAASSDKNKPQEITKYGHDTELNGELQHLTGEGKDSKLQEHQQIEFNNYYEHGIPPVNPINYPNYLRRDGSYGYDDSFIRMYRQLRDITVFRSSTSPSPTPAHQIYLPVIYIPRFDCGCSSEQNKPTNTQNVQHLTNRFLEAEGAKPNWGLVDDARQKPPTVPNLTSRFPEVEEARPNWGLVDDAKYKPPTRPDLTSRFPEVEEARPNWGLVDDAKHRPPTRPDLTSRFPEVAPAQQSWGLVNDAKENVFKKPISFGLDNVNVPTTLRRPVVDNQEDDFTRPISFVPIRPNRPSRRPLPSVEHGSFQAG